MGTIDVGIDEKSKRAQDFSFFCKNIMGLDLSDLQFAALMLYMENRELNLKESLLREHSKDSSDSWYRANHDINIGVGRRMKFIPFGTKMEGDRT